MKKGNTPIINGFILAAACIYLAWYFTHNGLWNAATVVILIIMALLSAGQIIIWFMYFKKQKNNKKNK